MYYCLFSFLIFSLLATSSIKLNLNLNLTLLIAPVMMIMMVMCVYQEFVERLANMRHEHQQMMAFCDRLGLQPHGRLDSEVTNSSCPVATVNDHYSLTTDNHSSIAGDLITPDFDDVLRPSFKARRAPPQKRVPTGNMPRKFTRKEREKQLSEQLENERQKMREYALDRYLASLSDDDRWDEERNGQRRCAKAKRRLVRSSSLSKLVDDGWRYRVTVPKPFRMTVRESQKAPTKSRSSADFERQKSRQQMIEELECSMKFKASPAPATIYVPLLEELAAKKEHRRCQNTVLRQKEHSAMQRPFSFLRREEERLAEKHRRQKEAVEADALVPDANFKAKPFPYRLFSSEVNEWMNEQEEIKEWKRRQRAEKLLKSSSLPKNMTKKRPSHQCEMSSEDGCCAASKPGSFAALCSVHSCC